MSDPFYDYETIAKWWYDNQVTEAKVKRLYPGINIQRLQRTAMYWSPSFLDNFDYGDFVKQYSTPIDLAYWILHPENDSYGCQWIREHMRDERIKQEVFCDQQFNLLETLDPEVFERLEYLCDCWAGVGGYWLSQVAFYAVRIHDGRNDNSLGLLGTVG